MHLIASKNFRVSVRQFDATKMQPVAIEQLSQLIYTCGQAKRKQCVYIY